MRILWKSALFAFWTKRLCGILSFNNGLAHGARDDHFLIPLQKNVPMQKYILDGNGFYIKKYVNSIGLIKWFSSREGRLAPGVTFCDFVLKIHFSAPSAPTPCETNQTLTLLGYRFAKKWFLSQKTILGSKIHFWIEIVFFWDFQRKVIFPPKVDFGPQNRFLW